MLPGGWPGAWPRVSSLVAQGPRLQSEPGASAGASALGDSDPYLRPVPAAPGDAQNWALCRNTVFAWLLPSLPPAALEFGGMTAAGAASLPLLTHGDFGPAGL